MPDSTNLTTADLAKVAALDMKVTGLDSDVKEINVRIDGLSSKMDGMAQVFAHELRTGLENVNKQIADKGSTKWNVVFAGCAVAASVVGMIGTLALSPLTNDVREMKTTIMPRNEAEFRYSINNKRLDALEDTVRAFRNHHEDEIEREMDRVRKDNYELRNNWRHTQETK